MDKKRLSRTEEDLMHRLWSIERGFMKDIHAQYKEPKPAVTTLATLLKRIKDKGFITYEVVGNVRLYIPTVSRSEYLARHFRGLVTRFFADSPSSFASFFTKNAELSDDELMALRDVIDQELKKKKA